MFFVVFNLSFRVSFRCDGVKKLVFIALEEKIRILLRLMNMSLTRWIWFSHLYTPDLFLYISAHFTLPFILWVIQPFNPVKISPSTRKRKCGKSRIGKPIVEREQWGFCLAYMGFLGITIFKWVFGYLT